jgi:NAD-dependent dihydropyrimidine dehydrogenase PreA subunit
MDRDERAYIKLQQHLDCQPVGFPATGSGVEIKVLKHIFTPAEAEIATCLNYRPEPLETIFARAGHLVDSAAALEQVLDGIAKKGGLEFKIKNGQKHYGCTPLVIGMYELQLERLTPEFIKDFDRYISDPKFGIEFLSTKLPQMRTIPVAKSIQPQHNVSTFDEVTSLLQTAEAPFAILECICRKKRSMQGKSCRLTSRKETCLAIGSIAQMVLLNGYGREITREAALEILAQNQKEGLVLQPSNTQKADFICSCCGCCCGILAYHKNLPRPLAYWASNYYAVVDQTGCTGCGVCEERCQVKALAVDAKSGLAVVDLDRCLGCGVCVAGCPADAVALVKKTLEKIPPETREDLYEVIMAHKKGPLGKLALTGKLLVDALKTGQIHLLRS